MIWHWQRWKWSRRWKTWAGGSGRAAIDRMAGEEKDWTCILIIGVILIIIVLIIITMFPIIISSSSMVIVTIDDLFKPPVEWKTLKDPACQDQDDGGSLSGSEAGNVYWSDLKRLLSSLVLDVWFFCLRMSSSLELTLGLLKAWLLSESHWKLGREHSREWTNEDENFNFWVIRWQW